MIVKEEDVKEMIKAATMAPSGENAQPWHFFVGKENGKCCVDIYVVPERDESLYSWGHRAAYVAIGAAIENFHIKSAQLGYLSQVTLLPNPSNELHAARIILTKEREEYGSGLVEAIPKRVSNRKRYDEKRIDGPTMQQIQTANKELGFGTIVTTEDRSSMMRLGILGSYNERIMFGNKFMHKFFFAHVNWTRKEDEIKKVGFFIDTLELPLPVRLTFYVIKSWFITHTLNVLMRFNILASMSNAELYAQSSAIGYIGMPDNTIESALRAGMVLARVWLTSTKCGLSFQPIAGMVYLGMRVSEKSTEKFSIEDVSLIESYNRDIKKVFNVADGVPFFVFRVGFSRPPTAKSIRFSVDDVTTFA